MNAIFASKLNQNLISLVLAGMVIALGSYAYITLKNAGGWVGPTTINVIGTGEATAKPDVAVFTFAVRSEGKDAAEAEAKGATAINAVIAFLTEKGIDEEKDIKTTSNNLNPKYTYPTTPCMGMYCPPSEPKQDGFELYRSVEVKVRDTKLAGEIISGVGPLGATDVSGLNFVVDNTDDQKAEARAAAIEDARTQAEQLAKDLGVTLGDMTSYYEESPTPYPYYGMGGDMMMNAKAESAAPEMPTGENTITSRVNLTFEVH
jgi:uncharacterized protein YggE